MLRVFLNRLKLQTEEIIAENKRAFAVEETPRNKYSCLSEKYFNNQQELHHVFIDFKKVSDRAQPAALMGEDKELQHWTKADSNHRAAVC